MFFCFKISSAKKYLWLFIFIFAFVLSFFVGFYFDDAKDFSKTMPRYYSKQFCSCYFVMKWSEQDCELWTSEVLPIGSYSVNEQSKQVKADFLFYSASSTYESSKLGCSLDVAH